MGWALHYGGDVYREGDITIGQAERIEAIIGEGWTRLNVILTAKHAKATLAVLVADRTGRPYTEVEAEVAAIPANVYASEIYQYEADDLPSEYLNGNPPVGAEPSTGTRPSSRSPRGAGPRT
jgi:predicted Ser/Thr protein kinase